MLVSSTGKVDAIAILYDPTWIYVVPFSQSLHHAQMTSCEWKPDGSMRAGEKCCLLPTGCKGSRFLTLSQQKERDGERGSGGRVHHSS